MIKQVFEIDDNGYIVEIYVKTFDDDGNPVEALAKNMIPINPPDGLYRARWNGSEWIEDMPQSEIDELNKPVDRPLSETEILGQQMTERELEATEQGQQITDIELLLVGMGVGKNA